MAGPPGKSGGGSISIGAGALEEAFETRPHLQRYATRLRRLVRERGARRAAAPLPPRHRRPILRRRGTARLHLSLQLTHHHHRPALHCRTRTATASST
jgi:hypothetical protein